MGYPKVSIFHNHHEALASRLAEASRPMGSE
jgi:hypothetical protein